MHPYILSAHRSIYCDTYDIHCAFLDHSLSLKGRIVLIQCETALLRLAWADHKRILFLSLLQTHTHIYDYIPLAMEGFRGLIRHLFFNIAALQALHM